MTPQEIQDKIVKYKRQIDSAKEKIWSLRAQGEQAQKQMDEARQKCVEMGIDPDRIEESIDECEQKVLSLMSNVEKKISSLNSALYEIENS